jgi:hypothetical protein
MNNVIIEESDNRYKLIISEEQRNIHPVFWDMPSIVKLNKYFDSKSIKDVENVSWHFENTKDIYGSTVGFVRDIIKQIRYLEKRNLGFLYLSLDDIIVYYDRFFIVNASNLYPLLAGSRSGDKHIEITVPYDIEDKQRVFLSPEINKNKELPAIFNKTTSYYSFGKILEILLETYNFQHTSIAHVIKRTTHEDSTKRYLHFI